MKKNMAVLDRFVRLVLGFVMAILFFTRDYSLGANAGLLTVAVVFIFTAIAGRCPLYTLFRLNTRQYNW
ncbi:MAG: DUF2892 domain-containing protein [Chitinophagaceae bacterium]|jgi:hypothetical protein|nr:MAG: DUF2892 domain-containing protein [Chitinophagaceae bacterium]